MRLFFAITAFAFALLGARFAQAQELPMVGCAVRPMASAAQGGASVAVSRRLSSQGKTVAKVFGPAVSGLQVAPSRTAQHTQPPGQSRAPVLCLSDQQPGCSCERPDAPQHHTPDLGAAEPLCLSDLFAGLPAVVEGTLLPRTPAPVGHERGAHPRLPWRPPSAS